ncbi:FG-GAP-like repeat-containing protein [uncultured Zobellia sp.]|uniref:DUF7619 domain-containing protein n=1 Tax=uncultured Zobellia sp. TaxID=255433 RepID=UPI00259A4C91|nr:FG-GAP-like repeat-containing protein [uncultured Zobellia sp.]
MKKLLLLSLLCIIWIKTNAQAEFEFSGFGPGGSTAKQYIFGDYNDDGKVDIFFDGVGSDINGDSCDIAISFQDTPSPFHATCIGIEEPGFGQHVRFALWSDDLDQDGDLDVIEAFDDELRWYTNDGTGSFGEKKIITNSLDWIRDIKTADIDGDGIKEVLVSGFTTDEVSFNDSGIAWFKNIDDFETVQVLDNQNRMVSGPIDDFQLADLDNDGDLDIVASSDTRSVAIMENLDALGNFSDGANVYYNEFQSPNTYVEKIFFALDDIDSDGFIDILISDSREKDLFWLKNDGGGNFGQRIDILTNIDRIYEVFLEDLDGDGRKDIVFSNSNSDNRAITWMHKLDDVGNFGIQQIITNNFDKNNGFVAFVDYDGDGRKDIFFSRHYYDQTNNYSYFNNAYLKNIGFGKNEIVGKIQYDFGNDGCDELDIAAKKIDVEMQSSNGNLSTFSLNSGYYQFLPRVGEFEVNIPNLPSYYSILPESQIISFDDLGKTETVDFCITANQVVKDLNAVLLPMSEARPGFEASYQLVVNNVGTSQLSGDVTLQYNPDLTFLQASESPANQGQNSLSFQFQDLKPFEDKKVELSFNIAPPPTIDIGDALLFDVEVSPTMGDFTENDNSFTLEQLVIGSYDPNDITVLEGESISVEQAGEYLNYIIRFQNIGTASAINVRIENELDEKLDWDTFMFISSSHENSTKITDGNKVEFLFENIHLPDSTSNEPASHGYVAYKIKPKSTVQTWDFINATANIFFDFNPPIITNTATTQIRGEILPFETSLTGVNDITCNLASSSGNVGFEVSGGIPPYRFELLNSSGNVISTTDNSYFTIYGAGSYSVRISDSENNVNVHGFEIEKHDGPNISFSNINITDVSCSGGSNGTIEINPVGGFPPYRYRIDGGEYTTNNTFLNLVAKQYTIEVIDSYGCRDTLRPTVRTTLDSSTNCQDYDNDGIMNEVDNCPNTSNANQVDSDGNGVGDICDVGSALNFTTVIDRATCYGAKNGRVEVNTSGGLPPYQYSLLNRNREVVIPWQTSNILEGLDTGNHVLQVIDSESFIIGRTVTVSQPSPLSAENIISENNGSSSITVNAQGGVAPYQYQINQSGFSGLNVFDNLPNGEYQIEVVDTNGCLFQSTVSIESEQNDSLISTAFLINSISCPGANDAEIQVEATGGSEPYQYELLDESYNVLTPTQANNIFENLAPGNYMLKVIDDTPQESFSNLITILEPEELHTTFSKVDVSCFGANDGSIEVNADGGSAPYQYSINSGNLTSNNIFSNLSAATYTITVVDSNGCQKTISAIISEPEILVIETNKSDITCKGLNDGNIVANASGGVVPYQFSVDGTNYATNNNFSDLIPQTYNVSVKDAMGCLQTVQIIISEPNSPDFDNDGLGDSCDDDIDGDGISNENDQCSETPLGSSVDTDGCLVFSLPNDNFTIQTTGASCPNSSNGRIDISAILPYAYTASLTGSLLNESKSFGDFVNFENLVEGTYDICITITEHPDFEQCFSVEITEPESLSVSSKMNDSGKSVLLQLSGGFNYEVNLNGTIYATDDNEIELPLSKIENSLTVTTHKECQGVYEETIFIPLELSVYPNPVEKGDITVILKDSSIKNVQLTLYTSGGRQIIGKTVEAVNGIVKMNMDGFSSGMYSLKIETSNATYTRKIIKK